MLALKVHVPPDLIVDSRTAAEWERTHLPPDVATLLQRRRDAAYRTESPTQATDQ